MIASAKYLPVLVLTTLLVSCSSSKTEPKSAEVKKPAEPISGQSAFWKMYTTARTWSPDAQPLELKNVPMKAVKSADGKFGAWQAVFVSPAKAQQRVYTYSVVEAEGLNKDVYPSVAESWGGATGQQQPWVIQAFKTDSDDAYATAVKESADYMKKNPDKPVNFLLEQTSRHPDLAWRIYWGDTIPTSNYSVYVDASTGKFLEKMH